VYAPVQFGPESHCRRDHARGRSVTAPAAARRDCLECSVTHESPDRGPRDVPGEAPHPARDPTPDQPRDPVPDVPVDPVPDRPVDPTAPGPLRNPDGQ
jgi:hypothetical protein